MLEVDDTGLLTYLFDVVIFLVLEFDCWWDDGLVDEDSIVGHYLFKLVFWVMVELIY
jgi:hypothetical protein